MSTAELRDQVVHIINKSDERFLKMVRAMHEQYHADTNENKKAAAYTIQGKKLSVSEVIENNKLAVESIRNGDFTEHSEIRKKFRSE